MPKKTTTQDTFVCESCLKDFKATEKNKIKGNDNHIHYFCNDCIKKANEAFTKETQNSNFLGAVMLGFWAAAIGGIAWFAVAALTGWTIGFLAIGVGWLVGNAVVRGAGFKRGRNLQILSLVLTLIAIVIAELFVFGYFSSTELSTMYKQSISILDVVKVTLLDFSSEGLGSIFRKVFMENVLSPVGLFIWGIGLYQAFMIPKARRIG